MFQVLHSSAGAGKTHALVKHYLGHCLKSPDPGAYRHVLALTFTNKAAAEMKERVIGYLEKLAGTEPLNGPLLDVSEHLQRLAGVGHATVAERADAVLGHMLHHWSDVAISTIDAFTRRVVKPFARDLRMDHDLRMTTEQDHYREGAVNALIDAAGDDDRITELLTQACLQLLREERAWDPTRPLMDLSRELLNERSIGPLEQLRAMDPEELAPLTDRLNRSIALFKLQVNAIGREAVALFAHHSISEADVAHGRAGILSYFKKLATFNGEWEEPGANALKPIETGKWHAGKASPSAIAALDSMSDALMRLFHQATALREAGYRDHAIQRAVVRELASTFALHELDTKLEELKKADGVAFFSDLTRRVAEVVKGEPVPFIYERLGERYRHFLIDEFQDTSLLQWNALLPLIENALSTGGSTLLVGDAKQAIYRWRNGEVRLFVELPRLFGKDPGDDAETQREATLVRTHTTAERLDHNRRSSQHIIAFNNALFGALSLALPDGLKKVYGDHDQRTSRTDPGLVRVEVDSEEARGEALQALIQHHVLRSLQEALADGYLPSDVAVLVRSKRVGRAVAAHLVANGFEVVSPDGLHLAADPVVQLLVELLRYLHQGEAIAAVRVLQWKAMVHAVPIAGTDPSVLLHLRPLSNGTWDPVAEVDQWLAQHGGPSLRTTLAALVGDLARAIGLPPADDAAVLTLLDEIHTWSTDHAQDIGGFLEHWERSGGQRSAGASGGAHAVQVMTVHKSKGLQFPVVIVPDTRMASSGNHGELFWVDPGTTIPELRSALIRDGKVARSAALPEIQEEDELRTLDALNLLYVAFTRPEHRLYAFVPKATDAISKALLSFVQQHSELAHTPAVPSPPRSGIPPSSALVLRDVAGTGHAPLFSIRMEAPNDRDGTTTVDNRFFGTAVHGILEATRTAQDLDPELEKAVQRGSITREQAEELRATIAPRIASAELAKWFDPQLDVRAETTLITAAGQSLRPDRLVFDGDTIRVLEMKTGKASRSHVDQLKEYLDLLFELGYADVQGTIWYLISGKLHHVER